jgi:hypothetical protein
MTKTNTVAEKSHARLSASGADWWTNCPGGPALAEGLIDVTSQFAAEGTAAHSIAERCVREGRDPAEFIGQEVKVEDFTFEVDDEMADGVRAYIDAIEPFTGAGWEWDIEVSFENLAQLHPDLGGTGDFVAYNEKLGHLVVIDFKYGKNISVDPIAAAERTEDPNAPRITGDWCRFCKAAAICPEAQARALAAAQAEFQTDGSLTAPDPEKFTADQLGQALRAASFLETWVHRVHEFGHAQAQAGVVPTGFKLVAKRAVRKWKSEGEAFKFLKTRLPRDEIFTEKMKSPAMVEPLIAAELDGKTKKARFEAFAALTADLVEKKSSGTVLAPFEDKRPSVTFAASEEFQAQPEFLS